METLLNPNMLQMVFENRNQSYGAYDLRRTYDRRLKISFILAFFFIMVSLFGYKLVPIKQVSAVVPSFDSCYWTPVDPSIIKLMEDLNGSPKPRSSESIPTVIGENSIEMTQTDSTTQVHVNGTETGEANVLFVASNSHGNNASVGNIPVLIPPRLKPEPIENNPDVMPQFPGGEKKLYTYLDGNIDPPSDLMISKKVLVQFIIEKDGSIGEVRIINNEYPEQAARIIQVIQMMPKWTPGLISGHPVRVNFMLPIVFQPE